MSVIAKLSVSRAVSFGTGTFIELGCVCENDLMAAYATSHEDKLFTKYSPWGEIRLNQRSGWAVFTYDESHIPVPGERPTFYAVLIPEKETVGDGFEAAAAAVKVECYAKTKFAGDGSRVELREAYAWAKDTAEAGYRDRRGVVEKLSWKMQVDNPPAEDQFVPGEKYWLLFYDAGRFTMRRALDAAHGGTSAEEAAGDAG